MPQITLDVVSLDNKPLVGLSCRFDDNGGTIGRDKGNTLALPDPHRRVSRLQAEVSFRAGVPTITNSSAVLPICAGGTPLESGQSVTLLPGMSVDIGPYVLVVRSPEQASSAASVPAAAAEPTVMALKKEPGEPVGAGSMLPGLAQALPYPSPPLPGAPLLPKDDPLALLLGTPAQAAPAGAPYSRMAESDPFAALGLAQEAAVARPKPGEADPRSHPARPTAVLIPEDFNPFDLPSASARNTADPLASLSLAAGPQPSHSLTGEEASIDAMFSPAGAGALDGLLVDRSQEDGLFGARPDEPDSLLSQPHSSDPLALFGDLAPAGESRSQPMRDDLAEIGGAYQPPQALDPMRWGPDPTERVIEPPARAHDPEPLAPAPPPAAAEPATARSTVHSVTPQAVAPAAGREAFAATGDPPDTLTQAFLSGAGLPASTLPNGLMPETMVLIGRLLRAATTGTIEMLAVRANIKREVQASVTVISSEANNPLKFLHDADSVLQLFLGKRMRGFMAPEEALKDAFDDLGAHELGVIAGTRAALNEVLTKFDPGILGERLARGSPLERVLPAMRKTRLWDLYQERYAQIRLEVEDDFQSIFGKAFVAAYEAEAARMRKASAGGEPP